MSVAVTASVEGNVEGSEELVHVCCADCFWGEDVPENQAEQIRTEHQATKKHIENEAAGDQIEATLLRVWVERGY